MIAFDYEEEHKNASIAKITVLGVGGAGGNTVNCMIQSNEYDAVNFISINTDLQALKMSLAPVKIQIGQKSTKGLGAGANPDMGKKAAEEDLEKILEAVGASDIVFVTGGMGGGTGSGALPVVVEALRERGILTIVVVTKPFAFEGKRRLTIADTAIEKIKKFADTVLIIPNQKLLDLVDEKVSMIDGFAMINEVLNQSVKGISDIITRAGHINVDFADVKEIMRDKGMAVMGTGRASGPDRARKAALEAISSPILEDMDIAGARGVLINITGGANLSLHEISQASSVVYEKAHEDANIIIGSVIDTNMSEEVAVTIIATGFASEPQRVAQTIIPAHTDTSAAKETARVVQVQPKEAEVVTKPVAVEKLLAEEPVISVASYVSNVECEAAPVVELQEVREVVTQTMAPQEEIVIAKPAAVQAQTVSAVANATQHYAERGIGAIDVKDLDIPTFMRKHVKEKDGAA